MNEPTPLKKLPDVTSSLNEMESAVEEAMAEATATTSPPQKVAEFRQRARGNSVAEQMLGIAETIKAAHKEIDQLQEDMIMRLTVIRKTLGGKA